MTTNWTSGARSMIFHYEDKLQAYLQIMYKILHKSQQLQVIVQNLWGYIWQI
jgi:hypothetical protein